MRKVTYLWNGKTFRLCQLLIINNQFSQNEIASNIVGLHNISAGKFNIFLLSTSFFITYVVESLLQYFSLSNLWFLPSNISCAIHPERNKFQRIPPITTACLPTISTRSAGSGSERISPRTSGLLPLYQSQSLPFPHALFRDLREANQLHDVSLYIDSHHTIGAHKVF